MSKEVADLVRAVNEEIAPYIPMLSSERKRIDMRRNMRAVEKMAKDIRLKLLAESKEVKLNNKIKKNNKRGLIIEQDEEKD